MTRTLLFCRIKLQQLERDLLPDEERAELSPLPAVNIMWNKVVTSKINEGKQLFDRRSWVMMDNQIYRYKIDIHDIKSNLVV